MKSGFFKVFLLVLSLGVITASAHRQIRVLIVEEVGSNGYQHTCIRTGIPYILNELQHPGVGADSSNVLAQNISGGLTGQKFPLKGTLFPYDSGFKVDTFGNASNGAPIASAADGHRLVSILPNYDVLFFNSTTAMGNFLSTVPEKDSLLAWMTTHGTYCLHATSDTHQLWTAFDSVLGATFPNTGNGHTTYYGDLLADTLIRDTASKWATIYGNRNFDSLDVNYVQLRFGLTENVNPTGTTAYNQPYAYRFYEEWFSYLSNPRLAGVEFGWSNPMIVETFNEAALTSGGSPTSTKENDATPMCASSNTIYANGSGPCDHPLTWYRINTAGGRLYQQAVGHQDTLYGQNSYLRRIIYNALVWTASYAGGPAADWNPLTGTDTGTTAIYNSRVAYTGNNLSTISFAGNSITVTFLQPGANTVEIRSLDGRRLALINGQGQQSHTFTNLNHNTVYAILTSGSLGHQSKLVTIQ